MSKNHCPLVLNYEYLAINFQISVLEEMGPVHSEAKNVSRGHACLSHCKKWHILVNKVLNAIYL